jgi:type IV pilus assembly protein PilQ
MNSLSTLGGFGKKAIFALIITSFLALMVAGQRVEPQQQGKMYGDAGFVGEPINLKVVNADVRDILNYITEQYGINFVIDKSVKQVPVTVNVSDVPWNVALDSVLQSQELGVQVNGTILRVAERKVLADEGELLRKQKDSQLSSSPLYTEFIRLNYARASGTLAGAAGASGGFSGGTTESGVGSAATSGGGTGNDQGILGIVKRRLSRRGAVEVDGRSNTIIITDVRENIDAIRQLVKLLDQPEPQVEIETRIVVAQRNFLREIGVQLGASVANPFDRGGRINATTGVPNDNNLTGLLSLTTGAFGTAQITAALNLSEQKGQSKTIASPRVTALNNRPAQIESGSQIPVTTIQRNEGNSDQAAVYTTTFVNVPLRLSVTPQISDAGTVILSVVAENNTVNRALSAGLGGTPGIDTQRMQTEVLVPDGGTTVVGGVLTDLETESNRRTPGLSRIPILGNLFKTKGVNRNTAEILFFITPRIYRPDFNGNPMNTAPSTETRTTTIIQPVPLGNPASNSLPEPLPTNSNPGTYIQVPATQQPQTNPGDSSKP